MSHCVRRTSADITCMGYCIFCTSGIFSIGTLRSIIRKTRNKRFVFIRTIASCTDISSASVFLKNRAYLEIIKDSDQGTSMSASPVITFRSVQAQNRPKDILICIIFQRFKAVCCTFVAGIPAFFVATARVLCQIIFI